MTARDPEVDAATLDARSWAARRACRTWTLCGAAALAAYTAAAFALAPGDGPNGESLRWGLALHGAAAAALIGAALLLGSGRLVGPARAVLVTVTVCSAAITASALAMSLGLQGPGARAESPVVSVLRLALLILLLTASHRALDTSRSPPAMP